MYTFVCFPAGKFIIYKTHVCMCVLSIVFKILDLSKYLSQCPLPALDSKFLQPLLLTFNTTTFNFYLQLLRLLGIQTLSFHSQTCKHTYISAISHTYTAIDTLKYIHAHTHKAWQTENVINMSWCLFAIYKHLLNSKVGCCCWM